MHLLGLRRDNWNFTLDTVGLNKTPRLTMQIIRKNKVYSRETIFDGAQSMSRQVKHKTRQKCKDLPKLSRHLLEFGVHEYQ